MNDHSPSNDLSDVQLSDAALIRIAADGETDLLSAEQRDRLEQLRESDEVRTQIETEQSLREAFARAHKDAPVPAGLRERLQARLAQEASTTEQSSETVPEQLASQTSSQSFWRRAAATLAVAAAVAIGAVTLFQGGVNPNGTSSAGIGDVSNILAAREAAAEFVSAEHGRCVTDLNRALRKSKVVEAEALPEAVQNVLDTSANLEDLIFSATPGVEFNWAGPCGVPGAPSMHLSFQSPDHDGNISLFIQPAREDLNLQPDVTYTFGSAADGDGTAVYVWAREGFVYYLVSNDAPSCDKLLKGHNAPSTLIDLSEMETSTTQTIPPTTEGD